MRDSSRKSQTYFRGKSTLLRNHYLIICLLSFCTFGYAQNNVVTQVWAETGGLQSDKFGAPTAVDDLGNLYRAGFETNLTGGTDVKLQKLNDEGILEWVIVLNTVTDLNRYEPSKVYTAGSNIYVSGIISYFNNGETDFFVAQIDSDGNIDWFITDNHSGNDIAVDIIYDETTSFIYVCGTTERMGSYDLLLAAYDDSGIEQFLVSRDHNGNMDGAAKVYRNGSKLSVHGTSQSSATQWDMVTWDYDLGGNLISEERINGITASSEELKDGTINNGYINLTGSSFQNGNKDFRVVCLDANNNYLWGDTYNKNGLNEEGRAIVASNNSFMVTGFVTAAANNENILIRKYNLSGSLLWHNELDHNGGNDKGMDVLEDDNGNYLVLTQVTIDTQTDVYLYYINGSTGNVIWTEAVAEDVNKSEEAISIESSFNGEIYITYQVNGQSATEAFSYSELNFPTDQEALSTSNFFIGCTGQIMDDNDQSVLDIRYYSKGFYPDHYFMDDKMSVVLQAGDKADPTFDTQRIDYKFVNHNAAHIGQVEEYERETHFNYYFDDLKFEQQSTFDVIAWPNLYDNIDAFVSSNSEGFKMTLVLQAGANLSDIEFNIEGASGINVSGGDLYVQTILDDIKWLKPLSYPLGEPEEDNCISYDISSGNLKLSSPCELTYPYVIQLKSGNGKTASVLATTNLNWSTFYGGNGADYCADVEADPATGDLFIAGDVIGSRFPSGSGINKSGWPAGLFTGGLIVKFNHDAEIEWATVLNGKDLTLIFTGMGLYDNIPALTGKEVHVIGNFKGTYSPTIDDLQKIPSNAWQTKTPPDLVKEEMIFASFRNDIGTRLIRSPFGSPEADVALGMDISPGGLMYFYGHTKGTSTAGSSQSPPIYWSFPVYDPGDGSYFENQNAATTFNTPEPERAFVTALNLNTYLLEYSSLIRKDAGSSQSEFEAIYDLKFKDANTASYCGKGVSSALLGTFNPSTTKFATTLNQTHSEFTSKLYFSGIAHSPSGTYFMGIDDNGSNSFLSTPNWRNFQTATGDAFLVLIDGNTLKWDSYFGDGSDMDFYWHVTTDTNANTGADHTAFGKGRLAYNGSKSTLFASSSGGDNPVQTLAHPGFFNESTNATSVLATANFQADLHLNAFYSDGNTIWANHTWGTMFGGNSDITNAPYTERGSDYLADIETYDYNGKSYVLIGATSFSDFGESIVSDDTKFPIVDYGRPNSWLQHDNFNTTQGSTVIGPQCDITISRFEVTNIAQGVISLPQIKANSLIEVYPIPAKNEIKLTFKSGNINEVQIIDVRGQNIYYWEGQSNAQSIPLNVSSLRPGFYVLKVNNEHYTSFVKK